MKWILLLLLLPFLQDECSKARSGIPTCVQSKIDSIKKEPRWSIPAEVNAYEWNGKTVYLFNADCCDQFITLYDEACNYICAPSGGITGKGDRKCEEFEKEAKFVKLVWKDERAE